MPPKQPNEASTSDVAELLDTADKTLDRLKTLYEQYFLGIQKSPPTFIHSDLERKLRDLTQLQLRNTRLRYRLATLQQKFGSYNSYWRRTLRQIENGTYLRNLSKIGRDAIRTGADIPEEILAAMPKRMRDQVLRDRDQAIAIAQRRSRPTTNSHLLPPEPTDELIAMIREPTDLRRSLRTQNGAHVLDEGDAALDIDAFFEAIREGTVPPPLGSPDIASSASVARGVERPAGAPAAIPRAGDPTRATGPHPMRRPTTGAPPVVPRPETGAHPAVPGPTSGVPPVVGQRTTGAQPVVGQRTTGAQPVVPGPTSGVPAVPQRTTGAQPVVGQRTTGAQPVVPGPTSGVPPVVPQRTTGAQPVVGQRTTGAQPVVPQRTTGAQPVVGQRTTGAQPVVPGPASGVPPVIPQRTTGAQPVVPGPASGVPPVVPQRTAEALRSTTGSQPAIPRPPIPPAGAAQPPPSPRPATGDNRTIARPAASQASRPNPIAPGSAAAHAVTDVESMAGPFPRERLPTPARGVPVSDDGALPNRATPPLGVPVHAASPATSPIAKRAPAPPPQKPPPGMSDADVNALYAKYVKAKEMVGEKIGPGEHSKLLKTINQQAPKIMEQYKAKGVDFSVVVKDNQVIIRAKPKT